MKKDRIYINRNWEFYPEFKEEQLKAGYMADAENRKENRVDIPHAFTETGLNYFDEGCYQMEGCYRKVLIPPKEWEESHILFTVDGAAHKATLYVNGEEILTHQNGYTAFTADIAPFLHFGRENVIAIRVNSSEKQNIPPFGKVIDYMTYGGIYREIYIRVKKEQYIEDFFLRSERITGDNAEFFTQVRIRNSGKEKGEVKFTLYEDADGEPGNPLKRLESVSFQEQKEGEDVIQVQTSQYAGRIQPWNLQHPTLYIVKAELFIEGVKRDECMVRIGFRTTQFKADGFYLNGEKIKLRGLNRHQSYPYFGYAMPKRAQRTDADLLKKELAVNAVRTSHYPQSHDFLERCDEIGLLVFTEIPGWQHIGDEEWRAQACENTKEMVIQYRNHPSVFLWGVRINESADADDFYKRTNAIAHELDVSRSTGGVRFLKKSSLLEDVYTYNDFFHNGTNAGVEKKKKVTPDMEKAYLVSEFNGHMYPAKSFDSERKRTEHALRHARVLHEIYRQEDIAGGFGWCMFDYNTHKDFGSGDRICYHGVMDMFRNKKTAAYVYASQGEEPVFEISSSMDIGEHPACSLGEVYAFTNADSVRVYKNGEFVKEFFPDREQFGSLPHPPVIIDDFIGGLLEEKEGYSHKKAEAVKEVLLAVQKYGQNNLPFRFYLKMIKLMAAERMTIMKGYELYSKYAANWGDEVTVYRFVAIKDGKAVKEICKAPFTKARLELTADTLKLREEETYDTASIRLVMKDENGNVLSFYQEPVRLKAEGAIALMGPEVISLKGGMGGVFVKTKGITGKGILTVKTAEKEYKLEMKVQRAEAKNFADREGTYEDVLRASGWE